MVCPLSTTPSSSSSQPTAWHPAHRQRHGPGSSRRTICPTHRSRQDLHIRRGPPDSRWRTRTGSTHRRDGVPGTGRAGRQAPSARSRSTASPTSAPLSPPFRSSNAFRPLRQSPARVDRAAVSASLRHSGGLPPCADSDSHVAGSRLVFQDQCSRSQTAIRSAWLRKVPRRDCCPQRALPRNRLPRFGSPRTPGRRDVRIDRLGAAAVQAGDHELAVVAGRQQPLA